MTRLSAADRIRLVLAIVPWIIDHPGTEIGEIAARFGQSPASLVKTLEMVSLVGVPPYSPDALISVLIDDDRVWIDFADYFSKPLQLSTGQALALLASADALRSIDGADRDGSLDSALDKLAASVGVLPERQLDVHLGDAPAERLADIRAAIRSGDELELTYFNHSKNETTRRQVVPRRVRSAGGSWYVDAYCRSALDERSFRLDRVLDLEPVPATEPAAPDVELPPTGELFRPHGDMPSVTLRLGPRQHWVRESLPIIGLRELEGDRIEVTLAVGSESFIERLLLQLGPEAEVVDSGIDDLDQKVASAARRILARYEE